MSTEFLPKNLANGRATVSEVTIYTVPSGKVGLLNSILLVNTSLTTAYQVTVWIDFGAGNRCITPPELTLNPGFLYEHDHSIALVSGTLIKIQANVDNVIDYVLSGVEG